MAALLRPLRGDEAELLAAEAIDRFGSLAKVLAARRGSLVRVLGDGEAAALITASREAAAHALRGRLDDRPILTNSADLHRYLYSRLANYRVEQLRALYLDAHYRLLAERVLAIGTEREVSISVREVLIPALDLDANGIIIAHNHPSGSSEPSSQDKYLTRRLAAAAENMGVPLIDHVIVASSGCASFKALGLL